MPEKIDIEPDKKLLTEFFNNCNVTLVPTSDALQLITPAELKAGLKLTKLTVGVTYKGIPYMIHKPIAETSTSNPSEVNEAIDRLQRVVDEFGDPKKDGGLPLQDGDK